MVVLHWFFSLGSHIGYQVIELTHTGSVREPKDAVFKGAFRLPNCS